MSAAAIALNSSRVGAGGGYDREEGNMSNSQLLADATQPTDIAEDT
jgi:hypothetical protein